MGTAFWLVKKKDEVGSAAAAVSIPRTRHKKLLAALKAARKKNPPYYTPTPKPPEPKNLMEALDQWNWEAEFDDDYNVTGLKPIQSYLKFDSEEVLFKTLAPFVKKGEVLIEDENNVQYKWVFSGRKVKYLTRKRLTVESLFEEAAT